MMISLIIIPGELLARGDAEVLLPHLHAPEHAESGGSGWALKLHITISIIRIYMMSSSSSSTLIVTITSTTSYSMLGSRMRSLLQTCS